MSKTTEKSLQLPSGYHDLKGRIRAAQVQARLRKMVLDAVPSSHSKRNYAKALDDLFAFCASRPLTRSL
jgi:hypothetical protein